MVPMHSGSAEYNQRPRVDVKGRAWVKTNGKLKPAGKCDKLSAGFADGKDVAKPAPRMPEMDKADTQPLRPLLYPATWVVGDYAHDVGIESTVAGLQNKIFKPGATPLGGARGKYE